MRNFAFGVITGGVIVFLALKMGDTPSDLPKPRIEAVLNDPARPPPATSVVSDTGIGQPSANSGIAASVGGPVAAHTMNLTQNPDFRGMIVQIRPQMQRNYPDLEKELRLTAAEADELYLLLAAGAPQSEIDSLLGPAKSQQWQEYRPTRDARLKVGELRQALASIAPLTDAQIEPLTATVLAEQKRLNDDIGARSHATTDPRAQLDIREQTLKMTEESFGRVVESARLYLSPQQVSAMQRSMSDLVKTQRETLRAQRAGLEAAGR